MDTNILNIKVSQYDGTYIYKATGNQIGRHLKKLNEKFKQQ